MSRNRFVVTLLVCGVAKVASAQPAATGNVLGLEVPLRPGWTVNANGSLVHGSESIDVTAYGGSADCAHGMMPFGDEVVITTPPELGAVVAVRGGGLVTVCKDIPGGVLQLATGDSISSEQIAMMASLLQSLGTAHAPSESVEVLGKTVSLPPEGGAWSAYDDSHVALRWPRQTVVLAVRMTSNNCNGTGMRAWLTMGARVVSSEPSSSGPGRTDTSVCTTTLSGTLEAIVTTEREPDGPTVVALRTLLGSLDGTREAEETSARLAAAPPVTGSSATPAVHAGPDEPYRYRATFHASELSVIGHALFADSSMVERGYGVGLAYQHVITRSDSMLLARGRGEVGYDSKSSLTLDASAAFGFHWGDDDTPDGVRMAAVLGFDAIGVGQDAAADRLTAPTSLYAGADVQLLFDHIDIGGGYFWRAADAIDSELRLELGIRLGESARRVAFRFIRYSSLGELAAIAIGF